MAFLGWYDPDKKKAANVKLAEAIARYREKFAQAPSACLTSPQDAADLSNELDAGEFGVTVEARNYIAWHTFYIGQLEDAAPTVRGATT